MRIDDRVRDKLLGKFKENVKVIECFIEQD